MFTFDNLYIPPDVDEAYDTWSASCGQAALAAVLRCPAHGVRAYFPGHAERGYTTPTHMGKALDLAQQHWAQIRELSQLCYGLAFVQFTGKWTQPGVPVAAAYRHTHWIGCALMDDGFKIVYDVNWPQGWVAQVWWEKHTLPLLTAEHKGADGGYYIRWACNVGVESITP
jgi:hypothetical protein